MKSIITYRLSPFTLLSEFVIRIEFRQRRRVSNASSDGHRKIRFLDHGWKIPVVAIFVRGLVIVGLVVFLEFLLTPLFGMADVITAFLQTDRRHADFRKRKVIRSIE